MCVYVCVCVLQYSPIKLVAVIGEAMNNSSILQNVYLQEHAHRPAWLTGTEKEWFPTYIVLPTFLILHGTYYDTYTKHWTVRVLNFSCGFNFYNDMCGFHKVP